MHFHLPKPLHGWRELTGEVGIIVIGVLIALGAEQLVESVHSQHQRDIARTALRSELVDDDLPQAYARIAVAPCLDAQIESLQKALDSHVDRAEFLKLAKAYLPPNRTWDNEAWTAVVATGDLSHNGATELIGWSLPYRIIPGMGNANEAEHEELMNLRSLAHERGEMTVAERDREAQTLEHLRSWANSMSDRSRVLIAYAHSAGIDLTAAQQQQTLREMRNDWGGCIGVPGSALVDTRSQSLKGFQSR